VSSISSRVIKYYCIFLFILKISLAANSSPADTGGVVFPINIDWLSQRFVSMEYNTPQGLNLISSNYDSTNNSILKINFKSAKSSITMDSQGKNLLFTKQLEGCDILYPRGISLIDDYNFRKKQYLRNAFHDMLVKATNDAKSKQSGSGSKIEIIGADIAGQRVSLQVSGNININGRLQNQKRSQVAAGFREGKSTSFIIDQKQQLNIEGKIGDRISILVDQDSERDFDFENAMKIIYTGHEDDIVQKVMAGNISLSLPGTKYVTFSGKNNGLFGLKSEMKFGGINVTAIASIEKGKKEKLSIDGGSQESTGSVKDYEYRKGVYFYLDTLFRKQMYEGFLDDGNYKGVFKISPEEVKDLEVYKSVTQGLAGTVWGTAYVDPNNPSEDYKEERFFKRLVYNQDYFLAPNQGYIRMANYVQDSEILAVVYRLADAEGNTITNREYGNWDRAETDTSDIILKLIKPQEMIPSHPCWNLEFKNVYYLGTSGINPEGFELNIVFTNGDLAEQERDEDGQTWISKFGLDIKDVNGAATPDDIIDVDNSNIIKLQSGELWLPFLRPFSSDVENQGYTGNENPYIKEEFDCSDIYDAKSQSDINQASKFKIVYKYENRSSIIQLGPMVIDGSEVVTLQGQTLQKGIDYTIDYFSGTLTLLTDNATNPDAKLDVKFEKDQFFQLDKKTIMGARAQYDFGDNAFIGGTALYFSKSVVDEKVDVGYEPIRNFVWDLNGAYSKDLNFITRAIDFLPIIETDQPSKISIEGEIARVNPNPNTLSNKETGDPNGVGFIDDFEGAKRITSAPIMRRYWTQTSIPIDKKESQRGYTFWYNPYGGVPTKSIWPNKQVSTRAQNNMTEILNLVVDPEWATEIGKNATDEKKKEAWGGITYYFPPSYYDQSKTKFFEIWIHGNSGHLHIDLGDISEEQYLDGKLSTEDKPIAGMTGDNVLDEDTEDTGIDGIFDAEESINVTYPDGSENTLYYGDPGLTEFKRKTNDPHSDNWDWENGSPQYRRINGTEGNSRDVNGLYPDTEDRNSNYVLDVRNDYFTIDFFLDASLDEEEFFESETKNGWKLYRVPLSEFERYDVEGDVNWETIKACRLWIDDITTEDTVSIAKVELVGNEWQELGVAINEDSSFVEQEETFAITVINTEDNPDQYTAPKGVQGEYDRINEIRAKEQSLVLKINDFGPGLDTGSVAGAYKELLEDLSFITYKEIKLFVMGENIHTHNRNYIEGEKTPLTFFLKFGRGGSNPQFYEIRQSIYPGWDSNNNIKVDIDFLTYLKSFNSAEDFPVANDIGLQEYFIEYDEDGVVEKRIYKKTKKINGIWQYTGEEMIIKGRPMISRIKRLEIGLINEGTEPIYGELWLDELRLSDVRKDPGVAYRAKASIQLADLAKFNVSLDRRDADFHTVSERPSMNTASLNTSKSLSMSGSFSMHKLLPAKWGITIPITGSISKSDKIPKYLPDNADVLAGDNAPDSIKTLSESYGINTSFSKRASDFWLTKYTIDQLKCSGSMKKSQSSNVKTKSNNSVSYSGKISYSIPFGRDNYISPFKWAAKMPLIGEKLENFHFYYLPNKFSISLNSSESKSRNTPRGLGETKDSYQFGANSSLNFGYKILDNLNFSATKTSKYNLLDFRGDKLKILEDLSLGLPTNTSESYSMSFNPKLFSWFNPTFNYSGSYRWQEAMNSPTPYIDNLSNQNRLSTSFSLNLADILKSFTSPKSKANTQSANTGRGGNRGRGRNKAPQTDNSKDKEPTEEKPKKNIKLLKIVDNLLKKIQTIQCTYSVNQSSSNGGRIGTPNLLYHTGLTQDPGLPIATDGGIGLNPDNLSKNVDFSLRSGLNISSSITTSLSFSQQMSNTDSRGTTGETFAREYFPSGQSGRDGFPFPQYTVRWSGLNKFGFLDKIFTNLSLDHGFSGKESITYKDGEETQSSYRMYFQPLFGSSMTFKNQISSTIRMTKGKTITNAQTGTSITDEQNVTASGNWKYKGGFDLGWIPFLKAKRMNNDITVQMTFDYATSETKQRNNNAEEGKFAVTNKNTTWKISPKINYKFSQKITGGIFFQYGVTENFRTGKRTTRNGGFDINIAIRG